MVLMISKMMCKTFLNKVKYKIRHLKLDNKDVGDSFPTYIIGEIGSNHNCNFDTAKKLILAAKKAGCDAAKFQSYTADGLYSIYTPRISEMDGRTKDEETPYELIKRIQMPIEWHKPLKEFCDQNKITFCSSPFDESMVDILEDIQAPFYKIASYEITHYPLLEKVAKTGKPIIISTGNSDINDIDVAVKVIKKCGNKNIAILHCVSQYPPALDDMNILCIDTFKKRYPFVIGFSDHAIDYTPSMLAVSLGASIIEKHITLDKNYPGPDHPFALEPAELELLVDKIRMAERIMGVPEKRVLKSEEENHRIGRRGIIAKKDIKEGSKINQNDFVIKRPAIGLHPKYLNSIDGLLLLKSIKKDEWLTIDHIDGLL
jgi:sialic acid synthase SpsE